MTDRTPRPETWIELSASALRANLRLLRRRIGPDARFTSVIKGNAYGHCIEHYVPLAERCGVRHFAVSSAAEAERALRVRTRGSGIAIMGHLDAADLRWAVEQGVEFFVFDLERLDAARRAAAKVGVPAHVHLELETGLYRTGLGRAALRGAAARLNGHPDLLRCEGLCTHFAGAESSSNYYRIRSQIETFQELSDLFRELGCGTPRRHAACSAVVFNYPECIYDMVRVGIAQYGYWPSQETRLYDRLSNGRKRPPRLRRVMAWKSRVMTLKSVPAGKFVGYGSSYQAGRRMRLALVPAGYYHGVGRDQSNLGHVLIRGQRCRLVGVVNMNMLTADVTDAPEVRPGDEVVLIGNQGDHEITVGAFGERTNDLNYEVLVRLPDSIPRIVVD